MKHLSSLIKFGVSAALVGVLASACGGKSSTGDDGGGEAGSDVGGTSFAGKTSHGGSSSTAGKSPGGTSTGGSGTAGTGTSGAGGSSGIAVNHCNVPSDCVLVTPDCCGVCDGPYLTTISFDAYNRQYAGLVGCGVVTDTIAFGGSPGVGNLPAGGVGNIGCPPCAAPAPGQGTLKYFMPDCVAGICQVIDVRTSNLSLCKTAADCRLRNGTSCCEGCGGVDDYVAVRNDGSFEKLACSGGPVPCLACLPQPPLNATASCNPMTAHCEVVYSANAGGG
jgi:hypothetical protein